MTADTQNDWYRVLSLARSNAAQDLRISNEILEVSDSLIAAAKAGDLSEEQITEISKDLIKRELSDNSKEINFAITKLVGAL